VILALAGLPIIVLVAFLTSKNPSFQAEYPLYRDLLQNQNMGLQYWLMYGLYYFGWESFFRGFMLFGLKDKFGELNSVLIQTIPSCLVHIGKPDAEIFSSIIAGVVFGLLALRTRSIWPIFIWHWGLGITLDIFIVYA
jgi:membrane protease YdiL (CAAX protease family)